MAEFKKKAIYFIAINVTIFVLFELGLRHFTTSDGPSEYHLKLSIDNFEKIMEQINVLFLGDSKIHFGIDPANVRFRNFKVHNFAFPGEQISTAYYKTKNYIQSGSLPNLKVVFMQFNHYDLGETMRSRLNTNLNYYRYYEPWEIFTDDMWGGVITFVKLLYIAQFPRTLINSFQNNGKKLSSKIQTQLKISPPPLQSLMRRKKYFVEKISRLHITRPKNIYFYQKLSEHLKKNNVSPFLLQLPDTSVVLANDRQINKDKFLGHERQLRGYAKRYLPKSPFLNYMSTDINLKLEHFHNNAHLTRKGAKIISKLISKDLNKLYSRR